MKSLLFISLVMTTLAAYSKPVSPKCYTTAKKAIEKLTVNDGYDKNGIDPYSCKNYSRVVICELNASKGSGAANDTYKAVLNKACTKVLRTELTGEE